MKTVVIPFYGFYESIHSSMIDDAPNMLFQDDDGTPNEGLNEHLWRACNYRLVYMNYAMTYARAFADGTGVKLKFESLQSPREYNFTTDRIFCTISREEVRRLWREVDRVRFVALARDAFTSRSGFMSFYDPDYKTWGSIDKWDHNQLSILLLATIEPDFDQYEFAEDLLGNGYIENWISEATPCIKRLYKISEYLHARGER